MDTGYEAFGRKFNSYGCDITPAMEADAYGYVGEGKFRWSDDTLSVCPPPEVVLAALRRNQELNPRDETERAERDHIRMVLARSLGEDDWRQDTLERAEKAYLPADIEQTAWSAGCWATKGAINHI